MADVATLLECNQSVIGADRDMRGLQTVSDDDGDDDDYTTNQPEEDDDDDTSKTLNFARHIRDSPDQVRSSLARFFSTGKSEDLDITTETFHNIFHSGLLLHRDSKVIKICVRFFYRHNDKQLILDSLDPCSIDCKRVLMKEVDKTNAHHLQHLGETKPPKYAVMFLSRSDKDKKQKVVSMNRTSFERFTEYSDKLSKFAKGFAACSCNIHESPYVLVSGGDGPKGQRLINIYDVILGKWERTVKMCVPRHHHMMATVNDVVYIFGGKGTPSIERFLPSKKVTEEVCVLKKAVHSSCIATHGKNIFVFGGKNEMEKETSSIQCIDTANNSSYVIGDLPCAISGGQAVVKGNDFYIASNQGHMIRYNVHIGTAEFCALQLSYRKDFLLLYKGSNIYLIGGVNYRNHDDSCYEKAIYRYSPDRDTWSVNGTCTVPLQVYTSCMVELSRRCPVVPFCT